MMTTISETQEFRLVFLCVFACCVITFEPIKIQTSSAPQNDHLNITVVKDFMQMAKKMVAKQPFFSLLIFEIPSNFALFRCFKLLFSPNVTLDEDKDLELQNRIRNLNWISTEHLNASVQFIRCFHESRITNLQSCLTNIYFDFFFNWQTEKETMFWTNKKLFSFQLLKLRKIRGKIRGKIRENI